MRVQQPDLSENVGARTTRVRFGVIAWYSSAAALAYLCRTCLGVAESDVRSDLGISEKTMGLILGPAFFWTYALGQIPMGWAGERAGSRKFVPSVSALWSLGTIAMSLTTSAVLVIVARGATGIAQAGLFPCATASFARWLPKTERAIASGILAACMSLGAAIGGGATGILMESIGWQMTFISYSAIGFVWAIGFYFFFRDTPSEHPKISPMELALIRGDQSHVPHLSNNRPPNMAETSLRQRQTPWLPLILNPAMWMICGQQFFRAAAYVFFASWFATWLQETRNVSTRDAGLLLTLPLIATVISSVFGGWFSDWLLRRTDSLRIARQGVSVALLLLCAVSVLAAFFVQDAVTAVLTISFGVFCAGFAGPCSYAVTIDMGGKDVALVFSMMNMVGNLGAGLIPWFVPYFRGWLDQNPSMLSLLGGDSWNAVLLLFVLLYLLAALCWMLLKPIGTVVEQSLLSYPKKESE